MIILASQSKIRKEYLERFNIPFTVQPAHIDESALKNEAPLAYVKRIALAKAAAVSKANPGSVVLAADTPVIVGRRILQTPQTEAEAREMLELQSGRRVAITTVVVVADASGKLHSKTVSSWVKFKRISKAEVDAYLASGHWQHVSGALRFAYIEHWIADFYGSYSGSRGLPLYETAQLLARAGITINPFAPGGLRV